MTNKRFVLCAILYVVFIFTGFYAYNKYLDTYAYAANEHIPARSQVVHEFTCINTVDKCASLMGETAALQRYVDEHPEGSTIYQNPPLTTSEPSYQPIPPTIATQPLTTSFPTAVLTRLDAIEARLDTIAKFQKDVVAPMHKEMLEKLKEMRGN